MLKTDLHHAVGVLRCLQAVFRFGNRPGHGLFGIEILAGGERVLKMASMNMQRTGDDYGIDIFLVEQSSVVIVCLDVWDYGSRFGKAARIDVRHRHDINIRYSDDLSQQLTTSSADANHADSYPVVCAEHARWIDHQRRCSHCRLFYEITPCN